MKKILFIAASAALALTAASCQKETPVQTEAPQELSLFAVSQTATKGYVTTTALSEFTATALRGTSPTATNRDMWVSAYINASSPSASSGTSSASEAQTYFYGKKFTADGETTPQWHANPTIYWPIAANIDLLAYSVGTPFGNFDVEWNATNAAKVVKIAVSDAYTQDDILYGAVSGKKASDSTTGVPMTFGHAQAWLTFKILANTADLVKVKSVTLENCYNCGELLIANDYDNIDCGATAEWSFSHVIKRDNLVDDNNGLYSTEATPKYLAVSATAASSYLDILIPQQAMTSFVIEYNFKDNADTVLKCRYTPESGTWTMGTHYEYDVTFNVKEMTIAPTVTEYVNGALTVTGNVAVAFE